MAEEKDNKSPKRPSLYSSPIKYITGINNIPKITDGNRIATAVDPNNIIEKCAAI